MSRSVLFTAVGKIFKLDVVFRISAAKKDVINAFQKCSPPPLKFKLKIFGFSKKVGTGKLQHSKHR